MMTVRRKDADRTRADILRHAQRAFSTHGYAASGIRAITAAAGVNPALAIRYFGSKERLFEEALSGLLDVGMLTRPDRARFGEELVEAFVSEPEDHINVLHIMALAAGDPEARAIVDKALRERLHAPLCAWFGGDKASSVATLILTLAAGFFTYRLLYPLDEWKGALDPTSRRWLERAFQSIVDGDY